MRPAHDHLAVETGLALGLLRLRTSNESEKAQLCRLAYPWRSVILEAFLR